MISIGTAWVEAAAFVRREKRLLAPLVLALMVVPVTVAQLIQPTNPFEGGADNRAWIAIAATAFVIGLIGQMAVSRMAIGSGGSLGETIWLALRRAPSVFGAFVIFGLCASLVLIPLIVIAMVARGVGDGQAAASGIPTLSIVLVFALAPKIILVPAIAMVEPIGAWRLLQRAWSATRGNYWRLLGFFLLFVIASQLFVLATTVVVGSIAAVTAGSPAPMTVSRLLVALAVGLVQGVAGALYAAMLGRIVVQLVPGSTEGM